MAFVLGPNDRKYKKSVTRKEYDVMKSIGSNAVASKLDEMDLQIKNFFPATKNPIVELKKKTYDIEFVEEIDFCRVNNLAFLLGDSPETISIRSLIDEDGFQKYLQNVTFGYSGTIQQYDQKYNMSQLTRCILEIFRMFTGLDIHQIVTHIPFYGTNFELMRNLQAKREGYSEFLQTISKQCVSTYTSYFFRVPICVQFPFSFVPFLARVRGTLALRILFAHVPFCHPCMLLTPYGLFSIKISVLILPLLFAPTSFCSCSFAPPLLYTPAPLRSRSLTLPLTYAPAHL